MAGRVMKATGGEGLLATPWYVRLRGEHPTEDECWPYDGPKQVVAVADERRKPGQDGMPVTVTVRGYLRAALMGEPYVKGRVFLPLASCAESCVNPWHTVPRDSVAGQGSRAGSRTANAERPLAWDYLTSLQMSVWRDVRGQADAWDRHKAAGKPIIKAHVKRMTDATLLAMASGDVAYDEPMTGLQAAQIIADAGFKVRGDLMNEAWHASIADSLPVGLRVALGIDGD